MQRAPLNPLPPGVNLPWQTYGCDFGANAWQPRGGLAAGDRRARLAPVLGAIARSGARVVRWFLLCDGRAGIRFDPEGHVRGLDDHVLADVEAALDLLEGQGLQAMFVLTDFLWFARPVARNGVGLFGKRGLVSRAGRRAELLDRVVSPLVARFANDPRIHSWDAFNEPEWAVLAWGARDPRVALRASQMKGYLGDLVRRIRVATRHPVTVGLATPRGLGLVRDLDLDFYQWHWYDPVEKKTPLSRPVGEHRLERGVLLGEYPTRGSGRSADDITAAAKAAGYSACWPWSVLAEDEASDPRACLASIGPSPA